MKLLLDTCTFLWSVDNPKHLSNLANALIIDPENPVYVSSVSAWEISIKYGLGRLTLARPPEQFVPEARSNHGFSSLQLNEEAALYMHRLPAPHRDPFDRALVAQAIVGGMTIVTPDPAIARYPVPVRW